MKIILNSTRNQQGLSTGKLYEVLKETDKSLEFIDDDFDYRFILKAEFNWVAI